MSGDLVIILHVPNEKKIIDAIEAGALHSIKTMKMKSPVLSRVKVSS